MARLDKIVAVLEFVQNKGKSWEEIEEYCQQIDLDLEHASEILSESEEPLIHEIDSGFRPTLAGFKT